MPSERVEANALHLRSASRRPARPLDDPPRASGGAPHFFAGSMVTLRISIPLPSLWMQILPLVTLQPVARFISLPLTDGITTATRADAAGGRS